MALKDKFGIYASITPCAGDAVVGLHPDCCASGIFRNREANETFRDPALRRRLKFIAADIFAPQTSAQFAAFAPDEHQKWSKMIDTGFRNSQ